MAALGGFQTCFPDKMVVISQAAGCCKPNLSIYKYFWDLVHDAGLCKGVSLFLSLVNTLQCTGLYTFLHFFL